MSNVFGFRPESRANPNTVRAAAARPITGQQRMMTGNRMATGTQPPPTGQAAYGVALQADIQVADRPITQSGIGGMKTGQGGPGRQVQDKSFFLGLFRKKIGELTDELTNFNKQIDQKSKDSATSKQLEAKYEDLTKEVRGLEGNLADYNLAMDKSRSGTDPADILVYRNQLREKNAYEAEQIDKIFEQRKSIEQQIRETDYATNTLHKQAEDKITSMAPEKRDEYESLMQINEQTRQRVAQLQDELLQVNQAVKMLESQLAQDQWRGAYASKEKAITRMRREIEALEQEQQAANMDPEEARALMLNKVKEDKEKLVTLDNQLKETQDANNSATKALKQLSTDILDRKGDASDTQKYDVLFQRDQEMTEFIDSFEEVEAKEQEEQRSIQERITALLEHMSEGLQRENAMPSAGRHKEMREDLSFKERQLESATSTKVRLEQELQKRHSELSKINTLDDKISMELKSLSEKTDSMSSEMVEFNNIDGLRVAADQTRTTLARTKQQYLRRRDSVKSQVSLLSGKYERLKASLAEDETAKTLDALEQKLRHYEQNIFHLREYISSKQSETEYKGLQENCERMLSDLNVRVTKTSQDQSAQPAASYEAGLRPQF